ncbi:hypothetical protein QP794_01615 [Paenibacillus sp. UMB7766-LJ446]|uniref:hypothetical protein n=1 Tax=Paenibacillus sp. UMB7766-LJ446 TaxID=3046313 RepID=UPI00254D0D03|nr:hypothetical protein [Paenibacillus sp. UMB7766-LJ446]MDK8188779.1 hypothetical protein [Paenibacillus sp. UMB7766-LJ446]
MSEKQMEATDTKQEHKEEFPELEKLIREKIRLAQKLGLMDGQQPIAGYKETKDYKRIEDIDARLWELV